jgi:flagellar hook-length control protein FliK
VRSDYGNFFVASFLKLPNCDLARSLLHIRAITRQSSAKCEGSIMPEIASLPILSAANLPASGTGVSLSTPAANPTGSVGSANTPNDTSAGLPSEAAKPAVSEDFANVLQRQMALAAPPQETQLLASELVARLATGALPDRAAVDEFRARLEVTGTNAIGVNNPGENLAQSDPKLLSLTDSPLAAGLDAAANIAQQLQLAAKTDLPSSIAAPNPSALPGAALVTDLSTQQALNNVILAPGSAAKTLAIGESRVEQPAVTKNDKRNNDDDLVVVLPFLPVTPSGVQLDANLPQQTAGKRVATPSALAMPSATQGTTSKLLDTPANTLPLGSKTADFAGMLPLSADAKPDHSGLTEGMTSTNSFANALVAAQLTNPNHGVENRGSGQTAAALEVKTPVGARGWDGEVGDKLVWMVNRQEQRAELVLNPPQLGRVEVSLSMNGDQTTAQFVSTNPAVREALEAALPRLREMFADAGMSLGQAQVGAESSNHAANQSANKQGNGDNSRLFSNANDSSISGNIPLQTGTGQWFGQGRGLINVFA